MTKEQQIETMTKIIDEYFEVYCTTPKDIAENLFEAGFRYDENIKRVSDRYTDDQEERIRQIANSIRVSKYGMFVNNIELLARDLFLFGYVNQYDIVKEIYGKLLDLTQRVDVELEGINEVVFLKDIKEIFAEYHRGLDK